MLPLHGQPAATAIVRAYLKNPVSRAFLLHGPTGTGKTTTAHNLAESLGVDRSPVGGFDEIASGEQTAEAVRALALTFRLRPMAGDWRLIVVNECDNMTKQAETIWLDVLESLPPRVCIVFTTNAPDKLSQRFSDRCQSVEFVANARAVQQFVQLQWSQRMPGIPAPDSLATAGCRPGRSPSYRLAVSDLETAIALHEDTIDCAAADPRQWLVVASSAVWGVYPATMEETARGLAQALAHEMPAAAPCVMRSGATVARGDSVPADATAA